MLLLTSCLAQASIFGDKVSEQPLRVDEAFQLEGGQTSADQIDLVWIVAENYYLYQSRIELTAPDGVVITARSDSDTDPKDDPLFGQVEVFHELAEVSLKLGRVSESVPAAGTIKLSYQGCWEGGICYAPVFTEIDYKDLALLPVSATELSDDSSTAFEAPEVRQVAPLSEQDQFSDTLSHASLTTLLMVFFLAGLALSLTPCVFPMIPILSGIIAGQGHRVNTRKGLLLSTIYVLAMAVTYTIAGVLAGLFGANLQAAFQLPWVISLFSLIFLALALSMFGFYNLQFPSVFQNWLTKGGDREKGGSYAGVAVMGFLSALIVGPCMAAPLAGALIYIGQTGDPVLGGLALFMMSLGMGVPLIIIGTSAAKFMPRAGQWMENVKAGFGAVLLLMAVWMLDRIVATEVTMSLVALILIVSSVYLGAADSLDKGASGWRKLGKGLGLVILIYAVLLVVGLLSGGKSLVYPLKGLVQTQASQADEPVFATVTKVAELDQILALSKRNGVAVMLDYYADWCVSCDELDYYTFADEEVRGQFKSMQLIKVDVTANDAESKALTNRYNVFGPPTLVFYDKDGEYQKSLTLVGVPSPQQLLLSLKQI